VFSHCFYEKFLRCRLVAPLRDATFQDFPFMINRTPEKIVRHLFSQTLRPNNTANISGALPASFVFPWQTLRQICSPKTVLFRDKYRYLVHARYLRLDGN
jgi:hypothetical protein